jgi:DNA repair protein RecO (recombination protein O)
MRLLPREDPHEALFSAYAAGLAQLSLGAAPAAVLRSFERRLLTELGYALLLERDVGSGAAIEPGRMYHYHPERGPMAANGAGGDLRVSGRTLLDIARDDYARPETREEARELMRALIAHRLGNQKLHTRNVMMELQEL